jgi:type II secretory pathway pseudopilin PulG
MKPGIQTIRHHRSKAECFEGTQNGLAMAWWMRNERPAAGFAASASRTSHSTQSAFTMVEIVICLGIIAFAMVAIIGVLPSGIKVQKENREETIINQDGMFLLEAIRSGSRGIDDLTNYVESITVRYGALNPVTYTNSASAPNRLINGQQIVGLLSTPKLERLANGSLRQNSVSARIRAINGAAGEKGKLNADLAFRYLLVSEVVPFANRPATFVPGSYWEVSHSTNLLNNLYDVRLTLRWPLFQRGADWDTGRARKTFRTLVSGELARLSPVPPFNTLYFFQPSVFTATNTLAFGL